VTSVARPSVTGPVDGAATGGFDRRWLALTVMCFTILLISLDQTVLNVALPTLVEQLHPSASGLQWIADGYTLTNAVLLLFGGALGDRIGRRRVFLIGVTIFGGGSLACALVHSTGPLIASRAVMGLGAAFLMPATLSIVAATFTGPDRARAIGIWAGTGGIGTAAGPLLGGWLLQHFWWGSVFLINVPIAGLALVGGFAFVSESRAQQRPPLDPVAVALSAVGLAALTYGLIVAPEKHWGSATVIGSFAVSAVLLAAFIVWDGSRERPLVDLHLFANRTFSSALGGVTASFFAMFGVSFLLSQYIQFVQGSSAFGVGLRFVPLAVATLIGSNLAAQATARFGLRTVMVTGMVLVAGALGIYTTLSTSSGLLPVGVAFAMIGFGLGLVIAPASNAIINALPPDKVGAGSGLRSMVQLLGGSFGVAIIGNLATSRYRDGVDQALRGPALRGLPAGARSAVSDQIGDAIGAARHLPTGLARTVTVTAQTAFVSGVRLGAAVGVGVLVVAIIAAAVYVPGRPPRPPVDPSGAPPVTPLGAPPAAG
jgi:EmrB/QacA subfamily drug resistance transporter